MVIVIILVSLLQVIDALSLIMSTNMVWGSVHKITMVWKRPGVPILNISDILSDKITWMSWLVTSCHGQLPYCFPVPHLRPPSRRCARCARCARIFAASPGWKTMELEAAGELTDFADGFPFLRICVFLKGLPSDSSNGAKSNLCAYAYIYIDSIYYIYYMCVNDIITYNIIWWLCNPTYQSMLYRNMKRPIWLHRRFVETTK